MHNCKGRFRIKEKLSTLFYDWLTLPHVVNIECLKRCIDRRGMIDLEKEVRPASTELILVAEEFEKLPIDIPKDHEKVETNEAYLINRIDTCSALIEKLEY